MNFNIMSLLTGLSQVTDEQQESAFDSIKGVLESKKRADLKALQLMEKQLTLLQHIHCKLEQIADHLYGVEEAENNEEKI